MKALALTAVLVVVCYFKLHGAPSDLDRAQLAAPARPHLRFMSYDGDPTKPEEMRFQLDTPVSRLRRRSTFLKRGEIVLGTKFKLTKFQFKARENPEGGIDDVSEVTLEHIDSKEEMVLVLGAR